MRLSLSAAILLLTGNKVWAFAPVARRALVCSSSHGSVQTSSLLKATIDKPDMAMWLQSIAEAQQCLEEIEGVVQTAREYRKYLEEVFQVVTDYVNSKDTALIEQVPAAKGYLANIQMATSSAKEYVEYLEGGAKKIRKQLSRMKDFSPLEQDSERMALSTLEDLEETAKRARQYLAYLNGLLANPTSPPPPELANIFGGVAPDSLPRRPSLPAAPSVPAVVSSMPATPSRVGVGSGSYLDNISSGASSHVGGGGMTSYLDSVNGPASIPAPPTRKVGEPIPPQLRFLSAQYMEMLKQAANDNPLVLKDELEKRRVVEDEDVENVAPAPLVPVSAYQPPPASTASALTIRVDGGGIQVYTDSSKPLPMFSAKYLDELKQAAQVDHPHDELEKRQVAEARAILRDFYESWNPVSPNHE